MTSFFFECIFYSLLILSLGSYSAAFTVRWPIKMLYQWKQDAHELLSLPYTNSLYIDHSTNKKRSHCPKCHHTLSWFELIPLLSYFFLKRRCRHCHQPISYRYPTIELLHLICCAPLLWLYQDKYELLLYSLLTSVLITVAVIDFEHRLIPDECCEIILICALLLNLHHQTLENSVLGLIVGYASLSILRWFYQTARKREGIGLGDVKLIGVLGAWLGLSALAPLLLCASLSGILYNVTFNKEDTKQIPFGPFLVFSALLVFYL